LSMTRMRRATKGRWVFCVPARRRSDGQIVMAPSCFLSPMIN
jgi:hypothetical protein